MITVGPMALNQPQAPDDMEPFFLGSMSGGGYHTDMSRISSHDHSGGLMGAAVAVSIPDGSITAADLDPSVLAPYALVDGSKPFTGQVTMQADAVVRDALYFGQQGTALAPDVTLSRTGAGALRVDTHLGVGVNVPTDVNATWQTLAAGPAGTIQGSAPAALWLGSNIYQAATAWRPRVASTAGALLSLNTSGFTVWTVPAVGLGVDQAPAMRAQIAPTGTLTLTPDAGIAPLVTPLAQINQNGEFVGRHVYPSADNSYYCGLASGPYRWIYVAAVQGTIQTSSQEFKEGITPLSPAECYQAAKDVRWYEYAYLPPVYTPPEPPPDIAYDAADDNETKAEKKAKRDEAEAASKAAHLKMVAETAPARHQRGFVFPAGAESKDELGGTLPPVPDLFGLSDRQSTTPQADLATLGCALQEVIRRLEQLEGTAA